MTDIMPQATKKTRRPAVYGLIAVAAVVVAGYLAFGGGDGSDGGGDGAGVADPTDSAQVALGARVYAEACAACHGVKLEGQADWRSPLPAGGFPAPPHDASGHTWHHADRQLFDIAKYGGARAAPPGFTSNMPAFEELASDAELWAVLAYIKSRWPAEIRDRQANLTRRSLGR